MSRSASAAVLAVLLPSLALAQQTQKTAIAGTPDLAIASVTSAGGTRASKVIGAAVYNKANQEIGTVDDVILDQQAKAQLAVISVGGVLGVGGRLVAEPYDSLQRGGDGKLLLPNATKEALNKLPSFTYTP